MPKPFLRIENYDRKSFFPKHSFLVSGIALFSILILYYFCPKDCFFRIYIFAWIGFLLILLTNLYSVIKVLLFFLNKLEQKNLIKNAQNFAKAEEEFLLLEADMKEMQKNQREIEDRGDDILEKYSLLEGYITEIFSQGQERFLCIQKRKPLGTLNFWTLFHIFFGFLGMGVYFFYFHFSTSTSFFAYMLYSLLWLTFLISLVGLFLFRRNSAALSSEKFQKAWLLFHISISLIFLIFSCLHAFGFFYYGK